MGKLGVKFLIVVTITLVSIYAFVKIDGGELVVLRPVETNLKARSKEEFYIVLSESEVEGEFKENLVYVLEFHSVEFEVVEGVLMVRKDVANDLEYVANLTKKAKDKEWLSWQKANSGKAKN